MDVVSGMKLSGLLFRGPMFCSLVGNDVTGDSKELTTLKYVEVV